MSKIIIIYCAQALLVQLALSQCFGRTNLGAGLASYGLSSSIALGLGTSTCTGSVLAAPLLPISGYSSFGYNGFGYGNSNLRSNGYGYGSNLPLEIIPTRGGSLPVFSSSCISPTGITVVSENDFEGTLCVGGELPFVSAVAMEAVLPSAGAGAVSHSCGNGLTVPSATAVGSAFGADSGAYGPAGAIAPLSLASGFGRGTPVVGIVAPIDGCYPDGIYF